MLEDPRGLPSGSQTAPCQEFGGFCPSNWGGNECFGPPRCALIGMLLSFGVAISRVRTLYFLDFDPREIIISEEEYGVSLMFQTDIDVAASIILASDVDLIGSNGKENK